MTANRVPIPQGIAWCPGRERFAADDGARSGRASEHREDMEPVTRFRRRRRGAWRDGRSLAAGVVASGAMLVLPRAALANGRFPAAGQIAVDPADPSHLVVRTTFGLVATRDGGARWSWICEQAMGLGGAQDPMTAVGGGGALLVGAAEGLLVSRDGGCDWAHGPAGVGDHYCTDLATLRDHPERAIFLESVAVGAGFATEVWTTSDSAKTVTQLGADLPDEFIGLTLDVAPSDPTRIYVSGRRGAPSYPGAMVRSTNAGATWEPIDPPGLDASNLPFIAAVGPNDADLVYVRVDGPEGDRLLVTRNGGATWATAFEAKGALLGFALSPSGAMVALGGDQDGLYRASSADLAFEPVSNSSIRCLTWTGAGLYACGDEMTDGFTVGLSTDDGASFTPVMHQGNVCGPLACPAGSSVAGACPAAWDAVATELDAKECADPEDAGAPDAGDEAGAPSPPGSESGAGGSDGSGDGGCACAVPGEPQSPKPIALLGIGLAWMVCARWRVKRRPRARR
jgi:photosystem II stability/assembly factor-like uncharacterized protein